MPDQLYPAGLLPEDTGDGLTFAQFVSWLPGERLRDIEKIFNLPSPTHPLRERLARCWWAFYLHHQQKPERMRRRQKLRKIQRDIVALGPNETPFKGDLPLLAEAYDRLWELANAPDGRPPMLAFEQLVLGLSDHVYHHFQSDSGTSTDDEHFLRFISLNIDVLESLESKVEPIKFQMPRTQRQILRHLRRIAERSRQIPSDTDHAPPSVDPPEVN